MIINNSSFKGEDFHSSFWIDKTELQTSPTTCVHYGDAKNADAESFADKAAASTWVWDSVHPSVVLNGEVNYLLKRDNLSYKSDGTSSVLTGTDGDVMASFDPVFWKCYNTDKVLGFDVSHTYFDGAVTAHQFDGTVREYLHLGMFHMPNQTDYARSIYSTTLTPKVSLTNDAMRIAAEAKGSTYSTMTFLTWQLFDVLTTMASGSTDSQTTCGKDFTNGSSAAKVATSAMLTANGWTSSTKASDTTPLMWLYLSEPWGNVFDWVCGIKSLTTGVMGVAKDQNDARGVSIDNTLPASWEQFTTPGATSYIKEVCGENYYPFLSKVGGGSSSTYYCDTGYNYKDKNYCCRVGGYRSGTSNSGAFAAYVSYAASDSTANTGSRLQILDVNSA